MITFLINSSDYARRLSIGLFCCILLTACSSAPKNQTYSTQTDFDRLPVTNVAVSLPFLSNCTHPDDAILKLNTDEPVNIIVHGCYSSVGRFRSLADVFAFHGQQAICFNYDDRDRLSKSSAELINAIDGLSKVLQQPEITVIGHSQGGLIARRALIAERSDRLETADFDIRLVTISAPFGGIKIASHCGSKPMAWLSLGITKLICQIVTGSKYREIPPNSEFINDPGDLIAAVNQHVKIATDELDSCRRYNNRGECVEDDFVFSLVEQSQQAIESDTNLSSVIVKSGHMEIVGDGETSPTQLIDILRQHGILNPTRPEESEELAHLLTRIYLDASAN